MTLPPGANLDRELQKANLSEGSQSPDTRPQAAAATHLVNLRSATVSELQTVKGVGPARARALDALRSRGVDLSRSLLEEMSIFSKSDLDAFEYNTQPQLQSQDARLHNPG